MSNLKKISSPNPGKTELIMLLVFFGLIFLVFKCSCSQTDEEKATNTEQTLKILALSASQKCVEQQLKSPSTAEFPYGEIEGVSQLSGNTYIINSYVDSQNGFGAMIRTNYRCQVTLTSKDDYTCDSVELFE
jgi:hypothetical protein